MKRTENTESNIVFGQIQGWVPKTEITENICNFRIDGGEVTIHVKIMCFLCFSVFFFSLRSQASRKRPFLSFLLTQIVSHLLHLSENNGLFSFFSFFIFFSFRSTPRHHLSEKYVFSSFLMISVSGPDLPDCFFFQFFFQCFACVTGKPNEKVCFWDEKTVGSISICSDQSGKMLFLSFHFLVFFGVVLFEEG